MWPLCCYKVTNTVSRQKVRTGKILLLFLNNPSVSFDVPEPRTAEFHNALSSLYMLTMVGVSLKLKQQGNTLPITDSSANLRSNRTWYG